LCNSKCTMSIYISLQTFWMPLSSVKFISVRKFDVHALLRSTSAPDHVRRFCGDKTSSVLGGKSSVTGPRCGLQSGACSKWLVPWQRNCIGLMSWCMFVVLQCHHELQNGDGDGLDRRIVSRNYRPVFSARCNIYTSRLCYDVSVRQSVRLSVTEVHWRIIANLGFKFWSHLTAHCGRRHRRGACGRRAACGRIILRYANQR